MRDPIGGAAGPAASYAAIAIQPDAFVRPGRRERAHLLSGIIAGSSALIVGLAVIVRILSIHVSIFDWDEYAFGLVGRAALAGHWPPDGAFDNKPCGLIMLFAAAQGVFGETVLALRLTGIAAASLTAAIVFQSARKLDLAPQAPWVAAALFSVLTLAYGGWASMSELVACPFIALASHMALGRMSRWGCLAFGALSGLAFQASYLAFPGIVLTSLAVSAMAGDRGWIAPVQRLAAIVLGFGVIVALIWTPEIVHHSFSRFVAEQIHYHKNYAVGTRECVKTIATFIGLMAVPVVLIGVEARLIGRDAAAAICRRRAVLICGYIGAILGAVASGRIYPHYFILGLPALSLIVVAGAERLAGADRGRVLVAPWLVAGVIAIWQVAAMGQSTFAHFSTGHLSTSQMARFGDGQFEARAAAIIDTASTPNDRLLVFDESPAIYFLAHRDPVVRYVFPNHYLPEWPGAVPAVDARALLDQALVQRPALVVVGHLLPTDVDAMTVFLNAGCRPLQTAIEGAREATVLRCRSGVR